jgi:hypothetical protein
MFLSESLSTYQREAKSRAHTNGNTHTTHYAHLILSLLGAKERLLFRQSDKVSTREDRFEQQVRTSVDAHFREHFPWLRLIS